MPTLWLLTLVCNAGCLGSFLPPSPLTSSSCKHTVTRLECFQGQLQAVSMAPPCQGMYLLGQRSAHDTAYQMSHLVEDRLRKEAGTSTCCLAGKLRHNGREEILMLSSGHILRIVLPGNSKEKRLWPKQPSNFEQKKCPVLHGESAMGESSPPPLSKCLFPTPANAVHFLFGPKVWWGCLRKVKLNISLFSLSLSLSHSYTFTFP